MILCVDSNWLPQSFDVQKNVNLEEILKHTKYFNTVEEALKDPHSVHVPIDFMVSIRSAYSNLVLEKDCKDSVEKRYYINMTHVDTLPHGGLDLIMYLASVGVVSTVDYTPVQFKEFNKVMLQSQFCPIGLFNADPDIINPIIYSQVVLHDDTVDTYKTLLKNGFRFVPISDMKRDGNIDAILTTLICVKGEKDEPTENNDQ